MGMTSHQLEELADKIEAATTLDQDLADTAAVVIGTFLRDAGKQETVRASDLQSTDAVIHLVDEAAPGWSIRLKGRAFEPNGHWRCSLRSNEARDEDEFIGHAKGPDLSNTLLAALLRILAYRQRK